MAQYRRRALADLLIQPQIAPVTILEGARAVGKTTMLRNEPLSLMYASYSTLADRATREIARADPPAWLRSLPSPAIVDEAQLLSDIEIYVKEIVDNNNAAARFLLTGSAKIRAEGFGSQRPLTNRSVRFRLHPFTQYELNGDPRNLAEALCDATLQGHTAADLSATQVLNAMTRGGYPAAALAPSSATPRSIRSLLSDSTESGLRENLKNASSLDHFTAQRVLHATLRNPASIVSVSKFASQLEIDRRTAARYLDELEDHFYHWSLHNFANRHKVRPAQNPKVHPVDVALSVALLQFNDDHIAQRRESFGALVESFVVNQIATAAAYSERDFTCHYWRDTTRKGLEVDLILEDPNFGTVAIEVKSSTRVGIRDARGIEAFRAQNPGAFRRGYVVYLGATAMRISDDIWALPIGAVFTSSLFTSGPPRAASHIPLQPHTSTEEEVKVPDLDLASDVSIFVSYTHEDNDAHGGIVIDFVNEVQRQFRVLTATNFNLFVDRQDLSWGENWKYRLNKEVETTTFLMPILTPLYFKSGACRDELSTFLNRTATPHVGHTGLLPLRLIAQPGRAPSDALLEKLQREVAEAQYIDVSALRDMTPGTPEFRRLAVTVAKKLHGTLESLDLPENTDRDIPGENAPDIATVLGRLEERSQAFRHKFLSFATALQDVGARLGTMQDLSITDPRTLSSRVVTFANTLKPSVAALDDRTRDTQRAWRDLASDIATFAQFSRDAVEPSTRDDLARQFEEMQLLFAVDDAKSMLDTLNNMVTFSKAFTGLRDAVRSAYHLMTTMDTDVTQWQHLLRAARP